MRIFFIALLSFSVGCLCSVQAQTSVNYDTKTVAAMASEYAAATTTESAYHAGIEDILGKYGVAEVATAGIFTSKYMDRKAMTSLGILGDGSENYYYRRIYALVAQKIIPLTFTTGEKLIKFPHKALYWGSYLIKVCNEVKSLCMQFESVVSNGSLSFSNINFLQVNPDLQAIVDLTKYQGVNWNAIWSDFSNVSGNFTKENLKADLKTLYELGSQLALGGYNNLSNDIMENSTSNETFLQQAKSLGYIVKNIYDIYQDSDGQVLNLFRNYLGDSPTAADIFSLSNYNITGWTSDYLYNAAGAYYTQRWYIGRNDSGNELMDRYDPPTDDNSVINGPHWTRFSTTDPYFYPSSSQLTQVKNNSKNMSGWTDSRIAQLNAQNKDYTYSLYTYLNSYLITRNGKQTKKSYAYTIYVYKSWNIKEEVYEEYFDSYTMDLNAFLIKMRALVEDYNRNENGYVYSLKSDGRQYYELATDKKVEGSETAVISMTCSEHVTVGEGSTQYKCRSCGGSLDAHSKTCAMQTSVSDNELDVSDLKNQLTEKETEMEKLKNELQILQSNVGTYQRLYAMNYNAPMGPYYKKLLDEYTAKASEQQKKIDALQKEINEYKQALDKASHDNDVETDDYYRIPAIMRDVQKMYGLTWQDSGSWVGYTFIRKAKAQNIKGILTFSSSLSIARKPQYFLGIKIHRAIMRISWTLSADYSDTQVVETVSLSGMSDADKATHINQKLSQYKAMHPGCSFQVEYIKSEPTEADTTEDPQHLLWASDRIELARNIEGRLVKIYMDLVSLNRFMNYKLDYIDVMQQYGMLPTINNQEGKKKTLVEECFDRWREQSRLPGRIN